MKVFYVFLLVLVFGVVSSHGRTYENNASRRPYPNFPPRPPPPAYDEFFLVQQWPASYCSDVLLRRQCRPFRPHIPTYFTVHGLWAQFRGNCVPCNVGACSNRASFSSELNPKTESNLKTYWPNFNGKDQEFWRRNRFNRSLNLSPLVFSLKTYWPNLSGPDEDFWNYEYNKHASCISLFHNDRAKFFSVTLNLARNYDVTEIVLNTGIVIHGTIQYTLSRISNAVFRAFNVHVTLECNYAMVRNVRTVQLFQIYFCFDNAASRPLSCRQLYKNCPQNVNSLISVPFPVF